MAAETSTPLARKCALTGSVPMVRTVSEATLATVSPSPGSTSAARTAHVTARYIAPVSRYTPSSAVARRRETVDLPDPDGPSTATTHRSGRTTSATAPPQSKTPIVPGGHDQSPTALNRAAISAFDRCRKPPG